MTKVSSRQMLKNKFYVLIFILFSSVAISGCATTLRPPGTSIGREASLKNVCAQNNVLWEWDPVLQMATLKYGEMKARVLVGSDLVLIDGDRITLSAPVRTVRSAVMVPSDFQFKVINRLRRGDGRKMEIRFSKIRKIVIDAGHGGKDPGAIGRGGVKEKKIVLDISKRLKTILKRRGIKVGMTREKDEFVSLSERTEIASRTNADLFISVHANSSPVRSVHGVEVFSLKDLEFIEEDEAQRRRNRYLMFKNLSIKNSIPDVKEIVSDMLRSHKMAGVEKLAARIAKQTAKRIKTKNRGVKLSHFYVIRNTLIPAVLVEVGFLTNPKEAKLLQTSAYRQKVALGLAESILDHANGR